MQQKRISHPPSPRRTTNLPRSLTRPKRMSTPTEECGDLLIRNIWKYQTDCILDVRIANVHASTNIQRKQEAVEKKKYLQVCLDQRLRFSPIVVPCDGVLGNEAKLQKYYVIRNLPGNLAKKSGQANSETSNCMSVAMFKRHIDLASPRAE